MLRYKNVKFEFQEKETMKKQIKQLEAEVVEKYVKNFSVNYKVLNSNS